MMCNEQLSAAVLRVAHARVRCVGDIMLDEFVHGAVERLSPEAPIPVLRVTHEQHMLGGVGNVARNLAALGAGCHVVSAVGADTAGQRVGQLLNQLAGCSAELAVDPQAATTIKTRYIAGSQHVVRVDRERPMPPSVDAVARLLGALDRDEPQAAVIVLSDYGKGLLTDQVIRATLDAARRRGTCVIVDPKGKDYSRYRGATILTPNRQELAQGSGMPATTDDEVIAAALRLIERHDFQSVVATLSERGIMVVDRDGTARHLKAEAREICDVSGAGDTVVAVLAAALATGAALHDAASLANAAAGIVVGKVGTAVVCPDELIRAVSRAEPAGIDDKIIPFQRLHDLVHRWRRDGLRIGFTNGCFDLLHPGHVTLLAKAAAETDRLVVGLNSDASVRRLKGPTRPVQHEAARATVLASLASVSAVTIFEEDTPQRLIEHLAPDVLVKGGDYTEATVVGADFVRHRGGRVVLVDLVPQQSTSRLIERSAVGSSPGDAPPARAA
ncbi:MAG TPA: D-glycero-beta-D-manno-heptose-7-phosphate kinase [Pirellulales bacterium]|jgi:D-beta-D-heptose 7-phosphate kinase/D-beta-D-heptose 1-phosphate adenosyltransferase|nr:D-glycero-beta-D-manno-heptose-7-phosphate kinase [Pirellulales bacterium]